MKIKNRKNLFIGSLILLSGLVLAYSIFWWLMAQRIEKATEDFRNDLARQGYEITGEPVTVSGFPGNHEVHFSGSLKGNGIEIQIPSLDAHGFFFPGNEIMIALPGGLNVIEPRNPDGILSLENALVTFIMPDEIPASPIAEHLQNWQANGNSLKITSFHLKQADTVIKGNALLSLNQSLQPDLETAINLRGHLDLLQRLRAAGLIEEQQRALIAAILAVASKTDEDTGELNLNAQISISDQNLYVGPVRVASLPEIKWPHSDRDIRNQPALPQ